MPRARLLAEKLWLFGSAPTAHRFPQTIILRKSESQTTTVVCLEEKFDESPLGLQNATEVDAGMRAALRQCHNRILEKVQPRPARSIGGLKVPVHRVRDHRVQVS